MIIFTFEPLHAASLANDLSSKISLATYKTRLQQKTILALASLSAKHRSGYWK